MESKCSEAEVSMDGPKAVVNWTVFDVMRLNRKNKVSSLPFWIPGASGERTHQFRLVMLRGIIKKENPEEDPVAVYVEYLPPPSSDEGVAHPNNSNLVLRIPYQGNPEQVIEMSDTATFTERSKNFGFREALSADVVADKTFMEGTEVSLTLTIETGVDSVTSTIAKTTERITTSMWASAASAFSAVTSQVKKVVDNQFRDDGSTAEQKQDFSSRAAENPWDDVPPRWHNRDDKWKELLMEHLPSDDGTFLYGKDREVTVDQQVALSQVGLNHRAVMSANSMFDFENDIHEGLLDAEVIRRQRYELVPRKVSDINFWKNYMWKVAVLSTCANQDQVQVALTVLNAPMVSAEQPKNSPSPSPASWSKTEMTAAIAKAQDALSLLKELTNDSSEDDMFWEMLDSSQTSCTNSLEGLQRLRKECPSTESEDAAELDDVINTIRSVLTQADELVAKRDAVAAPSAEPVGAPSAAADGVKPDAADASPETNVTEAQESPQVSAEETPQASSPPATTAANNSFGDLPEIDGDVTPERTPAAIPAQCDSSSKKSDFALMPWEEDDDI